MTAPTTAERIATRSRAVTLAGLALMAAAAWLYLATGAGMAPMVGMAGMPDMPAAPGFALVAAMWWVMMVAMMIPSAAPAILLYAKVHRRAQRSPPPTAIFLAAYLGCWLAFSLLAAAAQGLLAAPATMALDSPRAAGALLVAAGLYQLSPVKDKCLGRCRSPAQFLTRHYRRGPLGAVRLGLLHGAYCVGCCWLLMAVLMVVGVMNLAWVAALTLFVAAEKLLPGGRWIARLGGAALILWGGALLLA